jgi:hypothetical protein
MWLGPALLPLVTALGGQAEHVCACGMKRGTCGCPACAALEQERQREARPSRFVAVRRTCDSDDVTPTPSVPAFTPVLALCEVPAAAGIRLPVATAPPFLPSRNIDEPPTPPPRSFHA